MLLVPPFLVTYKTLINVSNCFLYFYKFHFSVCTKGQFQCSQISFKSGIPSAPSLCTDDSVYTDCLSSCPLTCENHHNPPTCDNSNCKDGCECLPGFVLDGNKCVNATMCPCHHAGKAYYEGEKYVQDCNEWFVSSFNCWINII